MSVINTNIQAIAAARNLNRSQEMLGRALNRLSSGSKIVNPSDDAAGLAVSEKLDAQNRRVRAATTNVQNAISLVQTADGFMSGMTKILSRMSELGMLAKDVTKNAKDVNLYQQEFKALQDQLRQTIGGTAAQIGGTAVDNPLGQFNGIKLFGSDADSMPEVEPGTFKAGTGVTIQPGAIIGEGVVLGNNVTIAAGARIAPGTVIGNGVTIGANAYIGPNQDIGNNVVVQAGAVVDLDTTPVNGPYNVTDLSGNVVSNLTLNSSNQYMDGDGNIVGTFNFVDGSGNPVNEGLYKGSDDKYYDAATGKEVGRFMVVQDFNATPWSGTVVQSGLTQNSNGDYVDADGNVVVLEDGQAMWEVPDADVVQSEITDTSSIFDSDGNKIGQHRTPAIPAGTTIGATESSTTSGGLTVTVGQAVGQTMTIPPIQLHQNEVGQLIRQDSSGSYELSLDSDGIINTITDAIQQVANERASLGASQSRLELAASTLQVEYENLESAISRIRDVDVAVEATQYARYNILVQSGTAMLAQANQMPQSVLKLLQG